MQHEVRLQVLGSAAVMLGNVAVPFGVENGLRAQKLGKLDFVVSQDFANALASASSQLGARTPVTIAVAELSETGQPSSPVTASVPLCALLDNKFKFRIRLHASMPGSGLADNVDIDLPAKYDGCAPSDFVSGWSVSADAVLAAAQDGMGAAFLAYVPAKVGEDTDELPTRGAPYMGQRRIATNSEGGASVDPTTGAAKAEAPLPTFWQKYGTYIMIGGAVFLFAGGGGGGGGGEGEGAGQRRAAGGGARS